MRIRSTAIALAFAALSLPAMAAAPDNMELSGGNEPNDGPLLNPATLYKESVDALHSRRYADAKASLAQLLTILPQDAETNFMAGLADFGLKDWVSARKHYEAAVRFDRKLIHAQQELAVTYALLGMKDKTQDRLNELERQSQRCADVCADAPKLRTAIAKVRKALVSV